MSRPDITGTYEVAGMVFAITDRNGRLVMTQPDVPEGFEPLLEWTGPASLEIASGPWAGTPLELEVENHEITRLMAGGVIPIERTRSVPSRQPGTGLVAPSYQPDPERDARFEAAWKQRPSQGLMSSPSGFPAHQFVQWLMTREEFIFHGSNRLDIEEFQPMRESMEIANRGGHGNLGAVYGTHNGLWAMFFAIVDRNRARGSIRNGVATYTSTEGVGLDLYQFSIEHHSLEERPFQRGALYVFLRDRFERIPLYPEGPATNEWACFERIRPIAAIAISPEDFPFLGEIGGHNDDDLLRYGSLQRKVRSHVTRAVRIEDGVRLEFDTHVDPADQAEWLELGRRLFPDVRSTVLDQATVELSGPPAFVHAVEQQYGEWLAGSN